jgi:Flp pilus assembly protein TadB
MAGEAQPERQEDVPEAGEAVHLPEPSYLPVLVALGVTIVVVGVVLNIAIVILGALIAIVAIVRWVRATRQEMADLPLGH